MTDKWRILVHPVIKANPVIRTILCSSHQLSHLRKGSTENKDSKAEPSKDSQLTAVKLFSKF